MKEILKELKEIRKENQEAKEEIKSIRKENKELKEELQELKTKVGQMEILENKMERMEKENKKNNVIITGMEINNNNEEEIITKAEEIIKHLKIEAKIKKAKRIKGTMCVIEMETFQQKLKVMEHKWKLSNIQSGKIFITSDLTERERQIQKEIKEIRDEEKKKNSNVKMGYQRLFVEGKKYIWNKEKKCLEDNTGKIITTPKN